MNHLRTGAVALTIFLSLPAFGQEADVIEGAPSQITQFKGEVSFR